MHKKIILSLSLIVSIAVLGSCTKTSSSTPSNSSSPSVSSTSSSTQISSYTTSKPKTEQKRLMIFSLLVLPIITSLSLILNMEKAQKTVIRLTPSGQIIRIAGIFSLKIESILILQRMMPLLKMLISLITNHRISMLLTMIMPLLSSILQDLRRLRLAISLLKMLIPSPASWE